MVTVLVGTNSGVVAIGDDGEASAELVGSIGALRADPLGCWATLNQDSVARRDPDGSWTVWPLTLDATITAVLPQRHGALVLRLYELRLHIHHSKGVAMDPVIPTKE